MQKNTELLYWFKELDKKDIVKIYPHSRLLEFRGDELEQELLHLEESWCRKSIEEREVIKSSNYETLFRKIK